MTWHQDVAPIVHARCVGCHTEGGIAPFSLEAYSDAAPAASLMLAMVEQGKMPPWSAVESDDCTPRLGWKDDARLSADEKETLRAWVEAEAPEGDADTAAPLPTPPSTELTGITHELTPRTAFTPSGLIDQQICFVLDLDLAQTQWLTGLQVAPGDLSVVHHVAIAATPPGTTADGIRALAGEDGVFDCATAVGLDGGSYIIGGWVPGARPNETTPGTGVPILPGSVIVMNIHYHPTGFDHPPDFTTAQLRLTPTQPSRISLGSGVGNAPDAPLLLAGPNDRSGPEFWIPPGVADHTETMRFAIPASDNPRAPVTGMFPHMHYVGVEMTVKVVRATPAPGEPSEECLIHVPAWDFDWQRTYYYDADIDELPTIGPGDEIEVRCRYDNTMANPFVRRMLLEEDLDAPVEINLGEQTTDEMCLVGFTAIF